MIEGALLLPLFLLFWFSIVDWGITYYLHQTIVHRANAAARWAVVNPYDPDNTEPIKNMVVYGQPTAPETPGSFPLTISDVSVVMTGTELQHDRRIVITVSGYTWSHMTPFFAGSYTGRTVVVSLPTEDLE